MREKLIELLMDAMPSCYSDTFASQIADHLIANDVVPVVRCKDCKHRFFHEGWKDYGCHNGHGLVGCVKPDDFCSCGERRTDETSR